MKKIILSLIIFLFVFNVSAEEKVSVTLKSCVDGDTANFIMKKKEIKVRFLAIDTPESVHPEKEVEAFGKEASDYTCKLVSNAKKMYLEYDKNSDKEDKYGRLLAFVYADDLMVQKELIKVGYAKVAYLYADYTYTEELQSLEKIAKQEEKGIWGDESIVSQMENDTETNTNSESSTIWDEIIDLFNKLIDKIFELFKSML